MKKITNKEVKKNNRNRIYRYICKCGTVSNPDIAYELKLSLPTVTQNTRELIEMGLVEETGEFESTGGRKAKALTIAADSRMAVGLDITRNHIALVLANLTGDILKYERIQYPYSRGADYFAGVNDRLEAFLADSPAVKDRILGVGISFPGIVNLDKKEITDSHALEVKELSFDEVEQYFPYSCYFLNDANAGAYAEGLQTEDERKFFYLSLSNTVGGALYSGKDIVHGSEYRCGEAGHMTIVPDGKECYCGKKGCLDSYCTAKRLSEPAGGKLEEFFRELKESRPEFTSVWEDYLLYLTTAVNNIHMILDCDIVLGGYVGSYLKEYLPRIRKMVADRNTFSEDGSFVKGCEYKSEAAALGAALYVMEIFKAQV